MNKKIVAVLLLLIYISASVFSIQVDNINNSDSLNDSSINPQLARINADIQALNVKMDGFATKQEVLNLLQGHLDNVVKIQEAFRVSLIINFIVLGLALIGFAYGVLFYFKSKDRL
jgi:hypothetical protein